MAWFIEARPTVRVTEMPTETRTNRELLQLSEHVRQSGPVPLGALPSELHITNRPRRVTHLIDGGPYMASSDLRDLITEFEPETVFHPVQLRRSQRGQVIEEYYYINPVDPVDAIIPDAGRHVRCSTRASDGLPSFNFSYLPDLEFHLRRSAVAGRHLWHDVRQTVVSGLFMSDEFLEEAKRRGLDDWRILAPCREV